MNPETFQTSLTSAWQRKQPLLRETDAIRVLNGHASGTPRLVLELYGQHAIFFDYGSGLESHLRTTAGALLQDFGLESVCRVDRTVAGDEGREGNILLAGSVPETLTVREGKLRFLLEPRHPRNVGLFLDTRNLRKDLAERAALVPAGNAARVLNLFAYTGSLGLAALAGGAGEAVQVDVSARYLEWGRNNLRLNSETVREESCRFSKMDSERYLDWALKKGVRFDHIILDPPVFSRFEGKVFRWADDYFRLAEKSAALLSPGGILHAVTNYSGITAPEFAAGLSRLPGASSPPRRIPLPPDYDLEPDATDLPEGNALIYQVTVG